MLVDQVTFVGLVDISSSALAQWGRLLVVEGDNLRALPTQAETP